MNPHILKSYRPLVALAFITFIPLGGSAAVRCNEVHKNSQSTLISELRAVYDNSNQLRSTNLLTTARLSLLDVIIKSDALKDKEFKLGFFALMDQVILSPEISEPMMNRLTDELQWSLSIGRTPKISTHDIQRLMGAPLIQQAKVRFMSSYRLVQSNLEIINNLANQALLVEFPKFGLVYDQQISSIEKNLPSLVRWAKLEHRLFGTSEIAETLMQSVQKLTDKMEPINNKLQFRLKDAKLELERANQQRIFDSIYERVADLWLMAFDGLPTIGGPKQKTAL